MEPIPRPTLVTVILGTLSVGFYNEVLRNENTELINAQAEHALWKNSNADFKFVVKTTTLDSGS